MQKAQETEQIAETTAYEPEAGGCSHKFSEKSKARNDAYEQVYLYFESKT